MFKKTRKTPIGQELSNLVANISKSKVDMSKCEPPVIQEGRILAAEMDDFIDNAKLYTGAISGRPCHHFTKVAKTVCNSGTSADGKEVIPVSIGLIGCAAAKTLAKTFCWPYRMSLDAKKTGGASELEALEKEFTGGINCYEIKQNNGVNVLVDKCKPKIEKRRLDYKANETL